MIICPKCDGEGKIEIEKTYSPDSTGRGYYDAKCDKCDGEGSVNDDE